MQLSCNVPFYKECTYQKLWTLTLWRPKGAGRGGKCLLQPKQMEKIKNDLELCFGTNYHVCFDLVGVGGRWD